MIVPEQTHDALKSIQSLIVQARHQAYTAGASDVGNLLDDIELLPELLCDNQDRSREFRDMLEGIGQKHEQCRYIVDEFLGRTTIALHGRELED
jgi:hypothetical protein